MERQADGTLGNCYNCNEPGHIARDCTAPRAGNHGGSRGVGRGGAPTGRGRDHGDQEKLARGRDKPRDEAGDEDEGHQGFQACIDGGASTLSSHREVKRLSRAVYAVQPSADEIGRASCRERVLRLV